MEKTINSLDLQKKLFNEIDWNDKAIIKYKERRMVNIDTISSEENLCNQMIGYYEGVNKGLKIAIEQIQMMIGA